MDQRISLLVVDLSTHPTDINVDDISRGIEMKVPDVPQQHRPGHDLALIARKILQKLKFPRQKNNVLASSASGPRHQVDYEIADAQIGLLDDGVTTTAKRLDTRQQLDKGIRLDQIFIAHCAQSPHPIVDFSERADDQDWRLDAIITQSAHHRDAIDIRKHAIDRNHGVVAGDASGQRLGATRGQVDPVTAGRERVHELAGGFRIVLNDQNAAVSCHFFRVRTTSQRPSPV
jgi:hypothetical protein